MRARPIRYGLDSWTGRGVANEVPWRPNIIHSDGVSIHPNITVWYYNRILRWRTRGIRTPWEGHGGEECVPPLSLPAPSFIHCWWESVTPKTSAIARHYCIGSCCRSRIPAQIAEQPLAQSFLWSLVDLAALVRVFLVQDWLSGGRLKVEEVRRAREKAREEGWKVT